jgi:hypothetical protein
MARQLPSLKGQELQYRKIYNEERPLEVMKFKTARDEIPVRS